MNDRRAIRRSTSLATLAGFLTLCVFGEAATITVDLGGGGDFTAIQPALDAARDGDTVLVMPGEYVITDAINFNRLRDPADPTSPPPKDLILRSDQGAEVTVIRSTGQNSVVIFENGESEASVLDGLTLTGGPCSGGGVRCVGGSSPTIEQCTISGNGRLGGLVCSSSSGAGIFCDSSSPTVTHCAIEGNCTGGYGGGVACWNGSRPTLSHCVISGNVAGVEGGGVYSYESSPTLVRCRIERNHDGGACFCDRSTATLIDCTVAGNGVTGVGVGAAVATVMNCSIWGNRGPGIGCTNGSSLTLTNCTVSANREGGAHFREGCNANIENTILWGNDGGSIVTEENSTLEVRFSCVEGEGVWPGAGNINLDPLFVKDAVVDFERGEERGQACWGGFFVEEPDYRLLRGSPAIDAGTSERAPETDLEGNERPCGPEIDIGAYEYCRRFLRGDCNGDRAADISDAIFHLRALFSGADETGLDKSSTARRPATSTATGIATSPTLSRS